MDSFFTRFKNPLALIAIVMAQVLALAVQLPSHGSGYSQGGSPDGKKVTLLRQWASAVVTPFERVTHGVTLKVRRVLDGYVALRHTHEQNAELKQEIARLRQEQEAFAEDAAQGRRLQVLMDFKQHYISSTVAAQVIGTSGTERSRMVTIDKGSADGLKPEMAVMTPDGVVGKLRDVFPHTAQLLLLNDASAGAGVILVSSRIRGIVHGSAAGAVQITNLTADSRMQPGETIVTSGGDQVFPRGLPVGVIESVVPDTQHQPYMLITIKPNANLFRLEEVLVITGTQNAMPAAAQEDASVAEGAAKADAAALAAANKKAADLVAEKLPSLHQDGGADSITPANDVGGVPGVPNSGLPKPKPALHPDKYSPGAAPSAEELKPGAPKDRN